MIIKSLYCLFKKKHKKILFVRYTKEALKDVDIPFPVLARKDFGYLDSWDMYPEFTEVVIFNIHVSFHIQYPCFIPYSISMFHSIFNIHDSFHIQYPCFIRYPISMLHSISNFHLLFHVWYPFLILFLFNLVDSFNL